MLAFDFHNIIMIIEFIRATSEFCRYVLVLDLDGTTLVCRQLSLQHQLPRGLQHKLGSCRPTKLETLSTI